MIHYGRSGDGVEATLTTVPRDASAPGGRTIIRSQEIHDSSGQLLVYRRHGGLDAARLIPGGVLLLELVHEQLGGVFGGSPLLLERSNARL